MIVETERPMTGHGTVPSGRSGRKSVLAGVLAAALFAGACGGDNLFGGNTQAPRVTSVQSNGQIIPGQVIDLLVEATATREVRRLDIAIRGAFDRDTSVVVDPPRTQVSMPVQIVVPPQLIGSAIFVTVRAVDGAGAVSQPRADTLALASAPPAVQIVTPADGSTLPRGDSLLVRFRVVHAPGVKEVRIRGLAIRQDSLQDTRIVTRFNERTITFPQAPSQTLPSDTTLVRYLTAAPDTASENVLIIVDARDGAGLMGSDTTVIGVGGPRVEIRTPENGSQVQTGGTLTIQVFAYDGVAGVDNMTLFVSGAQDSVFEWRNLAAPDSVRRDTTLVIQPTTGTIALHAMAWNGFGIAGGTATPITLHVSTTAVADTAKPRVGLAVNAPARLELTDSIRVTVAAQDIGSAGLRRMGIVAIAIPEGGTPARDTMFIDSTFANARTGTLDRSFNFRLADFPFRESDNLGLPRRFAVEIHAFAVDTMGNCGASVTGGLSTSACGTVVVGGTPYHTVAGQLGQQHIVTAVSGFSRSLPAGGRIADAVVDVARQRLYLSNIELNRLEVLNLADSLFNSVVAVGSRPWGMTINNAADRLIVANSGGTNISFVDITAPTPVERGNERLLTPNATLFDVASGTQDGYVRLTVTYHDFSDRPQFIAEDANGVLLYSTLPTGTAPDGTLRWVDRSAGPTPEVRILFNRGAIRTAPSVAIAHIDSIQIRRGTMSNDQVILWDHVPGHPNAVINSGLHTDLSDAVDALIAQGSDIVALPGAWVKASVGFSDTTYVAASGNRQFVAFGEGGVGDEARIMLWNATTQSVSNEVTVADLVNNASERVIGVTLDSDGRFGGARGLSAAYFFGNDLNQSGELRLQGVYNEGVTGGAGGVALHPEHAYGGSASPATLSFIATANRTIRIVDTFHYCRVGEVAIRDNIAGQLRAALPVAGENAGLTLADPNYIIVRLYGVTTTGHVNIVTVRRKHLVAGWNPPTSVCG